MSTTPRRLKKKLPEQASPSATPSVIAPANVESDSSSNLGLPDANNKDSGSSVHTLVPAKDKSTPTHKTVGLPGSGQVVSTTPPSTYSKDNNGDRKLQKRRQTTAGSDLEREEALKVTRANVQRATAGFSREPSTLDYIKSGVHETLKIGTEAAALIPFPGVAVAARLLLEIWDNVGEVQVSNFYYMMIHHVLIWLSSCTRCNVYIW